MKQTPELNKIQENMKPGVITLNGFLGTDIRNLVDILIDDDAVVKRLGLTHEQIAKNMKAFRAKGIGGLGNFISVEPHFEVRVDNVRGKLPSPFGGKGLYQKTNITVRNIKLKKEITYSDLLINLIEKHGFYEGKGSKYRINPETISKVLEIKIEGK